MAPWQAAMLLAGAERGAAELAAKLAVLLQERGLGGKGEDIEARLARWDGEWSERARAARGLAERWAKAARGLRQAQPERNLEIPNIPLP